MNGPSMASELETRIADQMALLQADYYGVPPKGARAYVIPGEIVVVVLRETFTPAEKVLISNGDAETIQHSRRRFQQLSRENFGAVVEQATGEQVLCEVLGFWNRDAVWRRVELVEKGLTTKIVFVVSARLRVSEEVLGDAESAALYVYKGAINPKALQRKLDELAAPKRHRVRVP